MIEAPGATHFLEGAGAGSIRQLEDRITPTDSLINLDGHLTALSSLLHLLVLDLHRADILWKVRMLAKKVQAITDADALR